jgi:RND superfamily putative drug exporter
MFEAWGRWIFRARWGVLVLSGALLVASLLVVSRGGRLTTGSMAETEAHRARELLMRDMGQLGGAEFAVIFRSDVLTAADPRFARAVQAALAPLRGDPRIAAVRTPYEVPAPAAATMVSADGHSVLATVEVRGAFVQAARKFPALRARIRSDALSMTLAGNLAVNYDLDLQLESDLQRAELVSIPAALVLLALVFGTIAASLMPVGMGVLTVVGGIAAAYLLSRSTDVAHYSLNIITLIGLGVSIDYSLFIVRRHQEELDRGARVEDALARAMGTAGRAVAFSGLAVAIGLSGLVFFRGSYIASIGLAGAFVVWLAVLYALTCLPALLAVLGPAINAGRLWHRRTAKGDGFWHRLAHGVMRHPLLVLLPMLGLMVLIGLPFLTHPAADRGRDRPATRRRVATGPGASGAGVPRARAAPRDRGGPLPLGAGPDRGAGRGAVRPVPAHRRTASGGTGRERGGPGPATREAGLPAPVLPAACDAPSGVRSRPGPRHRPHHRASLGAAPRGAGPER